ncbi:MAG: hypothetical protein C4520_06485 [Candidatus Abyssobacteria bacterium SURF_5]|uniref:Amidohydrolase-related domain-containing protein n=1 Tax=Abyssobacteria bacterium (strain SURF_5) TaxID=2093360 RepID=A0A3A4P600_ABYX5|nr:MAG: hypothetical protein C4520_06485 [Candidatus Abyssubacteria bacterium SURF_5]
MTTDNLLRGGIDLHTHSGPSLYDRALDDFGLAAEAKEAGMRAVVIKAHECPTAGRAALVNARMEGVTACGGVVLNHSVGGFNAAAVDAALRMGGKFVWFPTFDSQNHLSHYGGHSDTAAEAALAGLSVLDEAGRLKPEIGPILRKIAENKAILGTGHLSAREILVLTDAALAAGVEKILITHADMFFVGLTLEQQVDLARKGAVLEKCYLAMLLSQEGGGKRMAGSIKAIGAESCVLVTDLGQSVFPHPVAGMRTFIEALMTEGISRGEIRTMLVENPPRLLGV